MEIRLAKKYGFCFGVQRAIDIAEENKGSFTFGPLIHNKREIGRLKDNFNVNLAEGMDSFKQNDKVIIRTHGIPKNDLMHLKSKDVKVINATCPYVTKPQNICKKMSKEGYQIVIFGDSNHPEVKGVMSYSSTEPIVTLDIDELKSKKLKKRVALVSQTTKRLQDFLDIATYLMSVCPEVRVFNTICNATLENQESAEELSKQSDIMIIIGGKNSSNTKQLLNICKLNCSDSYLIESQNELDRMWFKDKKFCGITAGASTPDWIVQDVLNTIKTF